MDPRSPRDRRLAHLTEIDPRAEILSLAPAALEPTLTGWLAGRGQPRYRFDQIFDWIYQRRVGSWRSMTTLPKPLRTELEATYRFPSIALDEERISADGTRKVLWRLIDGEAIESVLIPTGTRDTLCISSQAGCALACSFCATGLFGFKRNLTAGEIVDQVRHLLASRGEPGFGVNLVFMGMGEPLLNWPNLESALEILIDSRTFDIGARRITVSTVGVPERIAALGERFPQVRLAVSLHAATDELRDEIVPINRRHPLRELLAACRVWAHATGKRLTFEVIHLPGVNDRPQDVEAMGRALEGLPAKINLMRYNPIPGTSYRRPAADETRRFADALRRATGATVTVRRSRGLDIEGACGQLRLARGGSVVGAPVP